MIVNSGFCFHIGFQCLTAINGNPRSKVLVHNYIISKLRWWLLSHTKKVKRSGSAWWSMVMYSWCNTCFSSSLPLDECKISDNLSFERGAGGGEFTAPFASYLESMLVLRWNTILVEFKQVILKTTSTLLLQNRLFWYYALEYKIRVRRFFICSPSFAIWCKGYQSWLS